MSTQKRIFSDAPEVDPPIRFSVRAKMIALLTLALSVVFTAIFWWAYTFTTARTMERLRADLNSTLLGAVKLADGDELASLAKDGVRDPDGFSHDPRYLHELDRLAQVHSVEPRAYAYSFLPKPGAPPERPQCIYLVDVWVTIDKKKAAPFLEPDTGSQWTQAAFDKGQLVERPDVYSDRWGRWLTSYAPIRNRAGEVVAVMGADFEASYVEEIQAEIRRSVAIVFGLSYAFALILVYIAAGFFSKPIQSLTRAAEALREDSLGKDIHIHGVRNDELGALARAFARMSRRLGRAFNEIEEANEVLETRVVERTADLAAEREKSEQLLRNILPADIADRLKNEPKTIADNFEAVTVMFADIVGFTEMSARVSPLVLVNLLNEVFSAFDALATQHGVEKIKTIGDAYMVVGGLPIPRDDHAIAICDMAIDMQKVMSELAEKHAGLGIRVGIHSGPVVAGVLGTKKFSYDLWGDTVNIASRMESHGERGRIQISETVVENLGAVFEVEKRGPVKLKGRGEMTTYWLSGRRVSR